MKILAIILIVFIAVFGFLKYNYKIETITFVNKKDSVITKSYIVPEYAIFHLWNGRLQYTKSNGWHETVQYNVKSIK